MRRVLKAALRAPLAAHAAALAVLLFALLPVVGTSGQFSADEGAAIAQARQLARGDGWTVAHPFPAADPDGSAFPFELSSRGGDQYAPFAKHPLYAVLLAGADRLLGQAGMLVLSILGTVAAAVMTALLARRLDPVVAVPALWIVGVASPLFFDSYIVIAHSIGAACAAAAGLCVVRAIERPAWRWPLIAMITMTAGTMLRTEMALFAIALSIGVLVTSGRRAMSRFTVVALVAGAGLGWLLDRALLKMVVPGPASTTPWAEKPSDSFIGARLGAFKTTWLLPSYDLRPGDTLLVIAVVFGALAMWLARTRPTERDGIRLFEIVAAAAGVAWLFLGAGPVPGLLCAFPLLAIGVTAWNRHRLVWSGNLFALTFVLFAASVLATQYASGGSGEWGARYVAIAIPVLVPVVLSTTVNVWRTLDRPTAMLGGIGLAVLSVALSVQAVVTLREFHRDVDAVVAAIDQTARTQAALDGGPPVVLASDGSAARFAFTVVEHTRWLTVPPDRLEDYGRRLRDLGVGPITLVARSTKDLGRLEGLYRDDGELHPVEGWIVASLRPR